MFTEGLAAELTAFLFHCNQSQQQFYESEVIISISWKRKYKWFVHGQTTRNSKLIILTTFIVLAFRGILDWAHLLRVFKRTSCIQSVAHLTLRLTYEKKNVHNGLTVRVAKMYWVCKRVIFRSEYNSIILPLLQI